jgi:dolichyl-diphosphooligosaccharide--protein glycosyltransferase
VKRDGKMKINKSLSRESVVNGFKSLGRFHVTVSHNSLLYLSALLLIGFIAFTIRILPIRWEIPSGTLQLGEFDSFFEYSLTSHMVHYGLLSPYWPTHWIDMQQNYPWGLDMAQSLPVLPFVGAALYDIVSFLGVNISLMNFCSILPPVLGTISVLVLYFIGKDMGGKTVGLLAALFLALDSSVIGRNNLGWYETEAVGVLGLVLFILFFLRAIDTSRSLGSSIKYSLVAGLALAFFCGGWGASYYLLGLVTIFVFVMILLRRASHHLLLSYSIAFGLGLFLDINMTYLNLNYLLTAPVLAVTGVFILLCLTELWHTATSTKNKTVFAAIVLAVLVGGFALLWHGGDITAIAGKFWATLNPFSRSSAAILESVAEHQITGWGQIYVEFGIYILFFIAGLYFTLKNPTNRNIFLVLFGLTGLYFAASMVRLLVILAPAFGLLAAMGVVGMLKPFYTLLRETSNTVKAKRRKLHVSREFSGVAIFLIFIMLMTTLAFSPQNSGMPRVYSSAYVPLTITDSSLPIVPNTPVPQWLDMLNWMQTNLQSTSVVSAWWDYGEWLSVLGNVTTLVDNTTENTTQIENVAYSFMANETQSLKMLQLYNASYVLVFVTLGISQSSSSSTGGTTYTAGFAGYGDGGKWVWMARISGEAESRFMQEGFMTANYQWTNETTFGSRDNQTGQFVWNAMGQNSTIYTLMTYAEQQWCNIYGIQATQTGNTPTYFNATYISGLDVTPTQYGGLIPLVALYKIDWQKYYNATGTIG